MNRKSPDRVQMIIAPALYLFCAFLLLLVPLNWLLSVAVSVVIHELCHMAAIRCFGIRIYSIRIGVGGVLISTQPMNLWQELICSLAGPMGGFLLLLLARWVPMIALCSGFHTLYNLLPVYPQDGGRALRCGARLLFPEQWANSLCCLVEYACFLGVGALGIYGTFILKAGAFPLLFAILFLYRSHRMKISLQSA